MCSAGGQRANPKRPRTGASAVPGSSVMPPPPAPKPQPQQIGVEAADRKSSTPARSEPPAGSSLGTSWALAQVSRARRHALSVISRTIDGDGDDDDSANGGTASGAATAAAAVAIPVSRLLELGHGATSTRSNGSNNRGSSSGVRAGSSRSHQDGGDDAEAVEAAAPAATAAPGEVVLGVLVFESLREGDVAVSSLFLQDETGM